MNVGWLRPAGDRFDLGGLGDRCRRGFGTAVGSALAAAGG